MPGVFGVSVTTRLTLVGEAVTEFASSHDAQYEVYPHLGLI